MSVVTSKAQELAKALARSAEYQSFKRAKSQVEKSAESKKQLMAFRTKQVNLQRDLAMGKKDDAKIKDLENTHRSMLNNKVLKDFLDAEYQFSQVMFEIQKIIGEAVGMPLPSNKR